MRKTKLLALEFVCAAALLSGCGKNESGTGAPGAESSTVVSAESASSDDISYAAMIPSIEDAFPDGTEERGIVFR